MSFHLSHVKSYSLPDEDKLDQKPSWTMLVSAGCAMISPLLFGFCLGFSSPILDTMTDRSTEEAGSGPASADVDIAEQRLKDLNMRVFTVGEAAVFASFLNIGGILGALSGPSMCKALGPRTVLAALSVPYTLGFYMISTGGPHDMVWFLVGRIITGIAVGIGSGAAPQYVGEIATLNLRGPLGCALQLALALGICLVNVAGGCVLSFELGDDGSVVSRRLVSGSGETYCQWRQLSVLGAVIAVLLALLYIMPESPAWLIRKGRSVEALAKLQQLRVGNITEEFECLATANRPMEATASHGETALALLLRYRPVVVIGIGLCVFQQISGVNAVVFYITPICKAAGIEDPQASANVVMALQVVASLISIVLVERAGRRALLLAGSSMMACALCGLVYYYSVVDAGPALAVSCLILFITAFAISLGPIPWMILGELFPAEIASLAATMAISSNWTCAFLVTLFFEQLQETVAFGLFAAVCWSCFFFTLARVPETQGKTVDEVLEELGVKKRDCALTSLPPSTSGLQMNSLSA